MSTQIVDYETPEETHDYYGVIFMDDTIQTLVTITPAMVDFWISEIQRIHRRRLRHLIVGLDIEWRPNKSRYSNNPVATLQLCVGRRCLIFQLIYAPHIPQSLSRFLANPDYTFVGLGIASDVEKMADDYGLEVSNSVDLRELAACTLDARELCRAGLKTLARVVLGKEIEKPKSVTMSRWDQEWLSYEQIQYACLDAFLSFEIGRILNASHW
ncbi:3'-5' exonuclease-like [Malania oleifera]|uniref:3'-5' exonuclease-like n=1 Tax=Malania oleifera TaxID=397392 RepID=UPI0025AE93B1|nr:3'-5' exonuclease-like [Malania oleifera]